MFRLLLNFESVWCRSSINTRYGNFVPLTKECARTL